MNHKAVVVTINVGGWIGLKLDGDVGHGRVELKARPGAAVLAQDVPCQVIPIIERQQVVLANMESKK